jgi:hypothetical protein
MEAEAFYWITGLLLLAFAVWFLSKVRDTFFRKKWDRTLKWTQAGSEPEVTWRQDYLDACPQSDDAKYWRIMSEDAKQDVGKSVTKMTTAKKLEEAGMDEDMMFACMSLLGDEKMVVLLPDSERKRCEEQTFQYSPPPVRLGQKAGDLEMQEMGGTDGGWSASQLLASKDTKRTPEKTIQAYKLQSRIAYHLLQKSQWCLEVSYLLFWWVCWDWKPKTIALAHDKNNIEYLCYWREGNVGTGIRGALKFDDIYVKPIENEKRVRIPSSLSAEKHVLVVTLKKHRDTTGDASCCKWISDLFMVTEWILLFTSKMKMEAFMKACKDVNNKNEMFKDNNEVVDFEGLVDPNGRQSSHKFTEGEIAKPLTTGEASDAARKLGSHLGITKQEEGEILYMLNSSDSLKRIRREWTAHESLASETLTEEVKEVEAKQAKTLVTYILDEEACEIEEPSNDGHSIVIRDKGHTGLKLADFLKAEHIAVGLEAKHIAALRIYTSPLYRHIQASLRNPQKRRPYPVTILLLDEALKLLRQVHARDSAQETVEYWRGMKDTKITEEFKRDGGTEYACMSTSTKRAVVAAYAKSDTPLIFRVIATSFASRGANISWLSLYPNESEVLFPPLTFLKYIREMGIKQCAKGNVVEVEAIWL